jgi:hypothetical protein
MPTISPTGWTLAGLEARLAGASIDLAQPAAGLATAAADRLLGLDLRTPRGEPRLVDYWSRGDDLVAVYEPADPRRLRATALWRPFGSGGGCGWAAWEIVVSAQTSLVESDSSLAVTIETAAGEMFWGRLTAGGVAWSPLASAGPPREATCLIVRRDTGDTLVAVHPADARRISVHREAGRVRLVCWLFSTLIEKGVLLRSRVLAAVGPAGNPAWADEVVAAFAASPPPLTT